MKDHTVREKVTQLILPLQLFMRNCRKLWQ